jgi:hypothetical protein
MKRILSVFGIVIICLLHGTYVYAAPEKEAIDPVIVVSLGDSYSSEPFCEQDDKYETIQPTRTQDLKNYLTYAASPNEGDTVSCAAGIQKKIDEMKNLKDLQEVKETVWSKISGKLQEEKEKIAEQLREALKVWAKAKIEEFIEKTIEMIKDLIAKITAAL